MKTRYMLFIAFIILIFAAGSAMALDQGETVTVELTVSSDRAVYARVEMEYDRDVFEFISAAGGNTPPNNETGLWVIGNSMTPVGSTVCTVTLRVRDTAKPGNHTVTGKVFEAYDVDYHDVDAAVTQEQLTVICLHTKKLYRDTVKPGCITGGEREFYCSVCGLVESKVTLPATGHKPVTVPGLEPSCTTAGVTEGSACSVCGEVFVQQEVIPRLPHDPLETVVIPAASGQDGLIGRKCRICGQVAETERVIGADRVMELPDGMTGVSEESFMGTGAQQIMIPDGVTEIGKRAFASCENLCIVVLPDSVTDIATDAFEGSEAVMLVASARNTAAAEYAQGSGLKLYRMEEK